MQPGTYTWALGNGDTVTLSITASVPGSDRGRLGLAALRQTLGAVRAVIVSEEPIARGATSSATVRDVLRRLESAVRAARRSS